MNYLTLLQDYLNRDVPNSITVTSYEDSGSFIIVWHYLNTDPLTINQTEVTPFDLMTFIYS